MAICIHISWSSIRRRGSNSAALLLLLITLSTTQNALALDPDRPISQALLRIWQSQQGLPRASIFSIRQTKSGYLWLGTQSGLFRFDGVRFVPGLRTALSQSKTSVQPWVRAIVEDHSQNLWVATDDEGLIRLQGDRSQVFGVAEGLPSKVIHCLLIDRNGELWVGTDKGLARFQSGKFTKVGAQEGLPGANIQSVCEGPDGKVWIGCEGPRLAAWDGTQFREFEAQSRNLRGKINALLGTPDGAIWVGTSEGLFRSEGKGAGAFALVDGFGNDSIYCLSGAKNLAVWVGTKEGLCRVQNDRIERFQTRDGLSQSTVFSLCEDQEGSLWVGTKNGLNQLVDRRALLPFTTSEGLPSNETGPILQDSKGAIWVGTLDAGLAKFDGRRFESIATVQNGLASDKVLAIEEDGDVGLWVGTDKGLNKLRDGSVVERLTTKQGLPADAILCLAKDRNGVLWAGTSAGLAEWKDGKFIELEGDALLHGKAIHSLLNYGDQSLIAATRDGDLYRIVDRKIETFSNELQSLRNVETLYLDQAQHLWLSLRGAGLARFDGKSLNRFTVRDGLFDDDIFGIVADDSGRLWMACSRGIFSVLQTDFQKFAEGKISQLNSTPYSPTEALRTIECKGGIRPSIWKMRDGRIWFSTIRGVMVVDPERSNRSLPPAPVVIEEVRVNGEEMNPQQMRYLSAGRNNLHFHYTALTLAAFNRIAFRYQLEGYDKDWIDAGQRRESFYTNLPPGDYRFRVQTVAPDGSSSEADAPVVFTLKPYFYQREWFVPLLLISLAGAGWLAYRIRIQQIEGRLQMVLAERSRIARELHDTLIQGFSGVTMQLQALAARLREMPERDSLSEIIDDAGGCLRQARRSVAGLRNAESGESGLGAAIARTARQLTETSDIELRLRLAPLETDLHPDVEYNLVQIVREAIANAIKHSGATMLEVTMRSNPRGFTISVRDDGSGFNVDRQWEQPTPGHYGLIGMRERAAQIGATISWQSELKQGTAVIINRVSSPAKANPIEHSAIEQTELEQLPLEHETR